MKTVIILSDYFAPAFKAGGLVQSITNLVNSYTDKEITFKIFCSNLDLDGSLLDVPVNKWIQYNKSTTVFYFSSDLLSIRKIKKRIIDQKPDILFINGIYSFYFNLIPLLFCTVSNKIISVNGMLHPGALSQKKYKKKLYLLLWQIIGLHKKYSFHASTQNESEYIRKIFGINTKIFIAKNFPRLYILQPINIKSEGHLHLISIALISAMKNHLLVLKALSFCKGKIIYSIYGPIKDLMYWNECIEEINKLPENIIVNYYGDLHPSKVLSALKSSHIFILPSKSENFGYAFCEALSAGRPIITSHNTPWNNLQISTAGINVNIASDKVAELSSAIDFFTFMGQNEYLQWSIGANKYANIALDLNEIKVQYEKIFYQ